MPKRETRSAAAAPRGTKKRRLNKAEALTPKTRPTKTVSSKPITISSSPSPRTSPTFKEEPDDDDDDEYEDIENEDDEEDEAVPKKIKKEKKDDDDGTGEPIVPRSMCLRCSKQLRSDPCLRCTRPTATSKCRRCSSMNKKCDVVPELFLPTLHSVQRLGLLLHRKEIEKPAFTKAASKYVSNVEAYGRKSRAKPAPRGGAKGAQAPEGNSVVDQLVKIEWRLEQLVRIGAAVARVDVPTRENGPAGFHAGEIDDD